MSRVPTAVPRDLQTPSAAGRPSPDPEALRRRIASQVEHCLARCSTLCTRHRRPVPRPQIRFDLRGQAAGQAIWQRHASPVLRFNLSIALRHADDFVATTVPHEVAHLVATACHGKVRPHGQEWQAVMRHLGIDRPRRCHDYVLPEHEVQRQRRWPYACGCCEHQLSTTRHKRVQRGAASYQCRRCGAALRFVGGSV